MFPYIANSVKQSHGVACAHGDSLGCDEGVLFDGGQDVTKLDFCREGVSVVDDWHSIWTIPAVHWKQTHTDRHAMSFHLLYDTNKSLGTHDSI